MTVFFDVHRRWFLSRYTDRVRLMPVDGTQIILKTEGEREKGKGGGQRKRRKTIYRKEQERKFEILVRWKILRVRKSDTKDRTWRDSNDIDLENERSQNENEYKMD